MSTVAYIGIGANLGDAAAQVRDAITALGLLPKCWLAARSSLYTSAPVDADGGDYVNAVARLTTRLSAPQLLEALQMPEHAAGRKRRYRNAPRTLDLDLLLFGDQQIHFNDAALKLTVPHPRMTERAFVLLPLLELDASIQIPGCGPAQSYAAAVSGQAIHKLDI